MANILSLSSTKAFRYFLEPENYCTLELPCYIDFEPVLTHVKDKIGSLSFESVLADPSRYPSAYENVNHTILIKKDALYSYRPIQVTNPYLYYLLVREITSRVHWTELKRRFEDFKQTQIEVSSIPRIKSEKDKSHRSASVSYWWEAMEQRSIALSLQYKYLFVTDIANCYGSIYTHSIAWALLGKEDAKKKRSSKGLLGNIIDRYIQGMQYGQTNGIPQGSTLFDFIAEIVLGYADMILCEELSNNGITEYKILRYRDDYRVFSNSKDELEKIAFHLQKVLSGLNFQLNIKKTEITEDIIQKSIKPDKVAYFTGAPLYNKKASTASTFQQELLYINRFGKDFPNSGTLSKLLTTFSSRIRNTKKSISPSDAYVMISMLVDIAIGSPREYKIILHLISLLLVIFPTTDEREEIVKLLINKFLLIPNIGELQIWMQHITYKLPNPISYDETICKIVAGEGSVTLWNNDWVKKDLKKGFPQNKICNNNLREAMTPIIDIDEFALFNRY